MVAIQTMRGSSVNRLAHAIQRGDERMRAVRNVRVEAVKTYAAEAYDMSTGAVDDPINTYFSLASTYLPVLSIDPSAEIKPRHHAMRYGPFAEVYRLALQEQIDEMRLVEVVEEMILNSLFGPAISWTGLAAGQWIGNEDREAMYLPEETFVEVISLDDYIPDPRAKRRSAMTFEATAFRVDLDWAMDSGLFNRKALAAIQPDQMQRGPSGKSAGISKAGDGPKDHAVDEIELIRCYLPDERKVVILPPTPDTATDYLAEADYEYDGADGPIDVINLLDVPDNLVVGAALIPSMRRLHEFINILARKVRRSSAREKEIILTQLGHEKDAETIRVAPDGSVVGVTDPKFAASLRMGGSSQNAERSLGLAEAWYNRQAGNPEAIGGLTSQSDTLGQDQMLFAQATARVGFWRKRVLRYLRGPIRKIAYNLWHDPVAEYQMDQELPGGQVTIPVEWTPDVRMGAFEDYAIRPTAYGMMASMPEQEYARFTDWVRNTLLPLYPAAQAQGHTFDVGKIAEISGRMAGIAEADEIIVTATEQMEMQQAMAQQAAGGQGGGTRISINGPARPGRQDSSVMDRQPQDTTGSTDQGEM